MFFSETLWVSGDATGLLAPIGCVRLNLSKSYKDLTSMAVPAVYFTIGPLGAVRLTENYKAIAADLGLGGGSSTPITGKSLHRSGALLEAQEAGRIRIQLRNGTSKRRKGVSVLCALDKMEEAPRSVIGKEFGTGWTIVNAGYPRKAVFS